MKRHKNTIRKRKKRVISIDSDGRDIADHASSPTPYRNKAAEARGPPFTAAFSIDEFCRAHRISVAFYYKLRLDGEGPTEMKVGARRLISFESAAAWRRSREKIADHTEHIMAKAAEA